MAIQSFADKVTEQFFVTGRVDAGRGWAGIHKAVRRKLDMLHYAFRLTDLKSPPGNRLEALKGKLQGHYSIRINDQWRVVFQWNASGPSQVRVTDYH